MKKYRVLIIILSIVFFLAALTFYLNRVVFPVAFKNIVTTQAETFLKRKVEIGSLHFSWVKGFLVDKIKVYQKDSDQAFVQAEQISFGIVFIPGFKQHRIIIPFINIDSPSAHLIRSGSDIWNFSDLLVTPPPAPDEKPNPFTVALTSVKVTNGKIRLDNVANGKTWTELLDNVNLKVGLSYTGITFDLSTDIPQKKGALATKGVYQPLTQEVDAQVQIKNIKPSDYAEFIPPIKGLTLSNGLIENIDLEFKYSKDLIKANGNILIKDIDVSFLEQSFKGNLTAQIRDLDFQKDTMVIDGNLSASHAMISLSPSRSVKGDISLERFKARRDGEGTQVVGALSIKGFNASWDGQSASGDISAKPITIQMKDLTDILITGDVHAKHLVANITPDKSFKGNVSLENVSARITQQQDIVFTGKLDIDEMELSPMPNSTLTGSITLPSLSFSLADGSISLKTKGDLNNWLITLDKDKSIVIESSFAIEALYPLNDPSQLRYSGTVTVHDAQAKGFPFGPFKDITLNADFKSDSFTAKLFSMVVMDTAIKGAGTVMNYKAPVLNIDAASDRIDLKKLKEVLPAIFKEYGLDVDGEASFNLQFQGLALDPLSGKIKAKAELRNVNVASTKFNQSISNISGTLEGTPDSLSWDNFSATYQGKPYILNGGMTNFKNPKIKTSLDGQDVKLKADIAKNGDLISIAALSGQYMSIKFSADGSVDTSAGKQVLDINTKSSFRLEDLTPFIPADQKAMIDSLKISGAINVDASIKGQALDWKNWSTNATITCPLLSVMGYKINDTSITIAQHDQKISNLTIDAVAYDGKIHAVGNGDLSEAAMPFDMALNIDALDMHKIKMDIPNLSAEEINGKFYLTTVSKGSVLNIKNIQARGSLAIREGFLGEFKIFKGLLGILNEGLKLGQVMITDVEGNFEIADQKITTDNLRLKSPTIVLLTTGWVNLDQDCDLKVVVDMTSGLVPQIAEEVLRSLEVRIYDKISNPKFDKKISVSKVINSLINTIGIFQ